MPKRLAVALLGALSCVVAATLASVLLSQRAHVGALHAGATRAAAAAGARFESEAAGARKLLTQLCTRDLFVERLALELAAGGNDEAEAARTALGLSRLLEAEVWLLQERRGAVALLGASGTAPHSLPSARGLAAAAAGPRTFPGELPLLIASCARSTGGETLWVVRAEPLERVRGRLLPADAALRFIAPARVDQTGSEHADALVLRLPAADEAPPTELWLRFSEPPRFDALLAFAPLFALLVGFGALSAYQAAVRTPIDDADLIELERAAERVARGDLTAQITRRSGGRADQTFQTFDRMTAELKDMRSRLAEAEREAAWQDMARRVAHEIKNPLSPIQTALETLRKAHQKQLPAFDEIFEESTRAMLEEVRRLERIVREFSEFARLPRARPGLLELSALVADAAALYRPEGVELALARPESPVQVRADREQLTQVLVNLLQNALDAARDRPRPELALRVETEGGAAVVHVDDNGPGVATEDRERIFEPYYTNKAHGSGLGLAIARRIVADHGGSLRVTASPLGGARFSVRLPRSDA